MKLNFIALFMFVSGLQVLHGQVNASDSSSNLLARMGQDSNRVLLLVELAGHYQFFNSDTAFALTNEALNLARKIRFAKGEAKAISRQGEVRHIRGDLPQALEDELRAIQLSRTYNFSDTEAESLTFIATIYLDLTEYRKALDYLFQAKKIYDGIGNSLTGVIAPLFPPYVLSNIGEAYEKLNVLDSALYFEKLALNYPTKSIFNQLQADILVKTGIIESRQRKYDQALATLRWAVAVTEISNDLLNRSRAQYHLAVIFNLQNKPDSAMHYARLAFVTGQQSSAKAYVLDAANLLTQLHKAKGNMDSAFYYQQTALNARDSLFGLDKFRKLQLLTLSEQQRVQQLKEEQGLSKARMQRTILLISIGFFLFIVIVLWRSTVQQKKANRLQNEKNLQIEKQSESLKKTLHELKATQAQLIQSEKMASLGELTAGIAHEIQNPLNFVNNFSALNKELVAEMREAIDKGSYDEVNAIAKDIEDNEHKILHHGTRADAIVKGMLQHSRASAGKKEPTDINALADEYLRLSYHGLKAKDKSFNANFKTDFDESIGKMEIVPQDIGRVLLNLYNNAFYAVNEKKKQFNGAFEPTVLVATKRVGNKVEIAVKDNGTGIPQKILDKIYQPFFTTKPTGQGTGLGLSLSYDIIKAHGGEIKVETKEEEGAAFTVRLPCITHHNHDQQ